jgi:hypothetical protein
VYVGPTSTGDSQEKQAVREVQVTQYEAWDGTRFDSVAKARDYEGKAIHLRIAGLTKDKVVAALDGTDPDLADAFERLGQMIRDARRKRGELKWSDARKKAQPKPEPPREDEAA